MRHQLDDMRERGDLLAALYASEAPIYGRFGYGLATYQASIEVDRAHGAVRQQVPIAGRIEMIDVARAAKDFAALWDTARRKQPGMLNLDQRWWRYLLHDVESQREGASPHYRVVYRTDAGVEGFALYRIKMDWDGLIPNGDLRLQFLIASTADAYAALWRHVLDVDLMARVTASMRPVDEPLRFLLADERLPKMSVMDGIWLRLVDVPRALAGRRYALDGRLVLRVRDRFCPWNDGHFELDGGPRAAQCQASDTAPHLELDAADLAGLYLGGNRWRTFHEAGRVVEHRSGAIAMADAMFAAERVPWCPSHF
jgi:predicted acetyltransferase